MKKIRYTPDALKDLRGLRGEANPIMAKIARYAETGAGDVKPLVSSDGLRRIRIGDYRAIFEEIDDLLIVTRIGHRRDIYD
jgi:mRNA interferase RelE/StbE